MNATWTNSRTIFLPIWNSSKRWRNSTSHASIYNILFDSTALQLSVCVRHHLFRLWKMSFMVGKCFLNLVQCSLIKGPAFDKRVANRFMMTIHCYWFWLKINSIGRVAINLNEKQDKGSQSHPNDVCFDQFRLKYLYWAIHFFVVSLIFAYT